MRESYIFVESPMDAEFLRRILPPELLTDSEMIMDGNVSENLSLARTILVMRKKPIVVVMDGNSLDAAVIDERRGSVEELIRAADSSVAVKVIAIVPKMEVWFFAAPDAIARVLAGPVPKEFLALGKRDPVGVLQHLAEIRQTAWDSRRCIAELDDADISKIRALPEVRELIAFLKNLQKDKAA